MIHARSDYDAIQPFPTKRPHHVKIDGELVMDAGGENQIASLGRHMEPIIPDDEPVFLVRGQDRAAIPTAEAWCAEAERIGADPAIIATVRRHIELVREWQATHPTKVPDAPSDALR